MRHAEQNRRQTSATGPCRTSIPNSPGTAAALRCSRARCVCRSSMKFASARSSFAPRSQYTAKRAPVSLTARSRSRTPSSAPRSQCGLGVKSNCGGVPQRRTSTLSSALCPTGTLACGRLGMPARMSRRRASRSAAVFSRALDLLAQFLGLRHRGAGVLPALFQLGDLFRGLIALRLARLGLGNRLAALRVDFAESPSARQPDPCRAGAASPPPRQIFANKIQIKHGDYLMYRKSIAECTPHTSRQISFVHLSVLSGLTLSSPGLFGGFSPPV